jgi:predicted hydrocarbon binding protein
VTERTRKKPEREVDQMDNKIFKELKFVPEQGGLFYNEVRYLLIRPETLAAFQKAIEEEIGQKAFRILFESGFQGGSLSSKKYREIFGFSDEEIIRFMMDMGSQIGWGRFELDKFDSAKKHLVVKVHHSPFAEAYGTSSEPVCHMIRGVLGGMASVLFGRELESKELSCLAKGDRWCRFEVM